jgi:cyclophilin family peptidyl-prolyl cis-trans isomerase
MGKGKRPALTAKAVEAMWGILKSICLLGLAGGAVFLLSKTSPEAIEVGEQGAAASEAAASLMRQRHVIEATTGRTFKLNLARLNDGATGEVVIQTHPEWSPIGVAHFHDLMDEDFYKDTRFFRVVPDFIVQWGIAADPSKFPQDNPIQDDPVVQTNSRGTISFATAGPNTRTTQLFVNVRKDGNAFLDDQVRVSAFDLQKSSLRTARTETS